MAGLVNESNLVPLVDAVLPLFVELVQGLFKHTNPTAPVPSGGAVVAAVSSSAATLATDANWLAAHPGA